MLGGPELLLETVKETYNISIDKNVGGFMMKEENIKEKKKQKAPLGIRPDDYIDIKFRELVEKEGISQTKLFERMFWEFTRNSKDALKLQALDCSVELQSISGASATLVKAIEKIVNKAQLELMSKNREVENIKEASDKKIELANIELANRVKELELKNKDLEEQLKNSNAIVTGFNTVKGELDSKIENLNKTVIELNNDIKEKDKIIQDKNKEIINSSKTIDNMEKEIALIKEQKVILEGKNASLQVNVEMLQGTINTFNSIKKTEIEAIKDNEATINQLKIDKLKAEFENEVSKLNNNIVSLEKDIELKESELKSLNNVISSKDLEIKTLIKENKQSKKLK